MKLKKNFVTHKSNGEQHMIDASGKFSGLVTNNSTAAFIVDMLKNDTSIEKIVDAMCKKYNAPKDVITKDVNEVIKKLKSIGAIDE